MFSRTLFYVGWRYLLRHPWQSILMILGITLGVAVVIAVDLANTSASRAFDLSTQSVTGKATHHISGGPLGLDEAIYTRLRRQGPDIPSAPVIIEYVSSPQLGSRPLQLLGIDPFADAPFRDYLGNSPASGAQGYLAGAQTPALQANGDLTTFLTRPGAVLISSRLAERYGLAEGVTLTLEVAGQEHTAFIAGLLQPTDPLSQQALDGLILADIATTQELTGRLGRLDGIDLILSPAASEKSRSQENVIRGFLPPSATLQPVSASRDTADQMTSAFRVNLTALSLLALVVGMFLIYNTITFSVVQRRPLFGTLRCLGVTRREIFALVLSEALIVGLMGAFLGIILGTLMGQSAIHLVARTINDLFFVITVSNVQIPLFSLFKGSLLGIFATLLTAAPPAWEAASVPPRQALSRSGLEDKAQHSILLAAGAGSSLILAGCILLVIPTKSLTISFGGTFAIIVGCALLVPIATGYLMRFAVHPLGTIWGTLGRMAPRGVASSLSRTSIAVMALMVAVSVTIGVSLMVSSFRSTVVAWLEDTLQGDIYISAPGLTASAPSVPIQTQVLKTAANWPGVARADVLRSVSVDTPDGAVQLAATDNPTIGLERAYLSTSVPLEQIDQRLQAGAVLVSEPLANRLNLPRQGESSITLFTANGPRPFPVIGIYYDYGSPQGAVLMALPVYQREWQDNEINAIALRLRENASLEQTLVDLQDALASLQRLVLRPNQALRQEVLVIFDRTFAITGALQLLATIVAFIGVLSALLSLELERQRELGILRAVGMTVRQVWGLILLETGLMGAVAGLLSMPTGYILALILVFIINRRSFGWTLQMEVNPQPFLAALAIAIIAALIAGIYPALRMGRMVTSDALRSE